MSEKDTKDKGKFFVAAPIGIAPTETGFGVEWLSVSSDEETEKEGMTQLMLETGAESWSTEVINPDGSEGKRSFYFSGAKWKAPWQPTGPKPIWGDRANSSEPIN